MVVSEHSYTVSNLQAFTEYEFRVVWIITSQMQLYSPSSPSYRTHAFGVPVSAPIIKDIQSSGPETVEVSWSPPLFPSGLIVGYNLLLTSEKQELRTASRGQSFQFYSTFPNTTYRFTIVAVNEVGDGPPAEANITTPEPTGISVNIHQRVVYFSEGNSIWVKGAASMSEVSDLKLFYAGPGKITSISVDWLYQRMYFVMNGKLGDSKVCVCNLENCTVAEDITFPSIASPKKIVADPYNGYIFYLLEDGIYRANLPVYPGQVPEALPIVRSDTLKDFVINFQSKRLIYFNKINQSFVSGFLDGSEFNILRPQVSFRDIESFVYENNTFVVTDGRAVFREELSPTGIKAFNEFVVDCDFTQADYFGYNNLLSYGAATQPYPLPTHPQLVTVLFGSDQAVVCWRPPEPTIGTSPSAWQNWTYIVKVSAQHGADEDRVVSSIRDTRFTMKGLTYSTTYEVSVRALSPAGEGPWTESFRGTTLKEVEEEPYILAVGDDGLWKQPLDSLGPGEFFSPNIRNVSDMDWYNDTLYWSNSTGEVHMWSLSRRAGAIVKFHISDIRKARILAFDWLGQYLYWAGKANTIYRKSLLVGHTDVVVHVVFLVKDLVVDAINGYLYWATTYTVESTRLNGEHYFILQEQPRFSGKQVVALTLDLSDGFLYWLVQDSLCLNLYRVSLCGESCGDAVVTEFAEWSSSEVSHSALLYYSGRLFWINGYRFITAQEVNQSVSIPFSQPAEFAAFTLAQRSLKPLPGNFSFPPKVIPDSILESSFRIEGNSSHFHILWKASTTVEWGTVFYCVESKFVDSERCLPPWNLTVASYKVEGLEPYMQFDFIVTPYTYWGEGPTTSISLRAPEEGQVKDKSVKGTPQCNYCRINASEQSTGKNCLVQYANFTEFERLWAKCSALYLFPVPDLITISANKMVITDIDRNQTIQSLSAKGDIKGVCYTANDETMYYSQEDSLFLLNIQNNSRLQLFKHGFLRNVTALAIDWIARHLFVALKTSQKGTQIFIMDLELKAKSLKTLNIQSHMTIGSLTVDRQFIYWTVVTKDYTTIYQGNKESKILFFQERAHKQMQILAYSTAMQPYPDKGCLTLASNAEKPTILNITNTSFTVSLPPVKTQLLCAGITLPTSTYLVYYGKVTNDGRSSAHCLSGLHCTVMELQENTALIEGLQPFSSYVIQAAVKNYYSDSSEQPPLGKETIGTTLYGVPEAVNLIEILVMSDNTINISWSEPSQPNGPIDSVRYQITVNFLPPIPAAPLRKNEFPNGSLAWSINGLNGGTKNVFKVLAFHAEKNWFSESAPVFAATFETPPVPGNIIARNTSCQLEWRSPLHGNITKFWFEVQKWQTKNGWFCPANITCTEGPVYKCHLTGVRPDTNYFVRAAVIYITGAKSTSPPGSFKTREFSIFSLCTIAGVPSKPGIPKIAEENKNFVQWEKAEDNGSNLTYHILESRKGSRNTSEMKPSWEVVYNGSCSNICTWKAKNLVGTYQFRAAAANMLGLGAYSGISDEVVLVKDAMPHPEATITTAVVTGVIAFIFIVIALFAFVWHRIWKFRKSAQNGQIVLVREDKELDQLRGLADAVGLSNACYAVRAEIECLPAFPRDKLNLHNLLGSGAFGEVYEGTAVDTTGAGSGESKVAVKTLKKGATDYEKSEFLKEAHLMSKFDHPHILKLLGVCLLNEPQYIILELMEGGDLLSYLRGARGQKFCGPLLKVADLLAICLDICKGCVYLEKMHFIHRDLAARNCLVSVKEYTSLSRIVKIGDFGLARDVYKNDYYRKRGEGLLPVRWMAPESLIDGVFTNRSDVWAFGVLVWETLTLGHQPYPGYSNLDVLHHVQTGGRLELPNNCPDDLRDLMTKCWAQEPHNRPTFCYIQDQLQELRNSPMCCTLQREDRMLSTGVLNHAFEDADDDAPCTDSESTLSAALMETRNIEGLNYLVLVTENKQDQENRDSNELGEI
ncbi:Proto-oncogene tyrosine-protein kinase ROS [Chelonia mydas]|uniref:Tyrosine-protein kinase receptor n=1 Tax=Chelonia mydas TaxID=8469 RepID=M7BL51_CHEMY|nr:Proto-oncogene tyrosine-protein kinase ROS [Chelonia mydas]